MGVAGSEVWCSSGGVEGRVRESIEFRKVVRIRRAGKVMRLVVGVVIGRLENDWCCRAGSKKRKQNQRPEISRCKFSTYELLSISSLASSPPPASLATYSNPLTPLTLSSK